MPRTIRGHSPKEIRTTDSWIEDLRERVGDQQTEFSYAGSAWLRRPRFGSLLGAVFFVLMSIGFLILTRQMIFLVLLLPAVGLLKVHQQNCHMQKEKFLLDTESIIHDRPWKCEPVQIKWQEATKCSLTYHSFFCSLVVTITSRDKEIRIFERYIDYDERSKLISTFGLND